MQLLLQDLRYGFRQLRRNPGFTAVIVLTLALGIGANTAIFSLLDAVMIKMLPVSHPEQLIELRWNFSGWPEAVLDDLEGSSFSEGTDETMVSGSFSYPAYRVLRDSNHVLSETYAVAANDILLNVGIGSRAASANGRAVSGNYYSALGVSAALGRTLMPNDDTPAAPPTAVISYDFWAKGFARDPGALGKTVMLDAMPFTVVGVTPPGFFGLEAGSQPDISVPLSQYWRLYRTPEISNDSRVWWMLVGGRLKPGISEQQAQAELGGLFRQLMSSGAASKPNVKLPVLVIRSASKGLDTLRRKFSEPLWVLTALVGLVLLIACANVASLLLSRATARQKEVAVRLSLGAGRWRILRQLLTESVLLSIFGGAAGVVVALWGDSLLLGLMSSGRDPISLDVHMDLRVLAFTAGISLLTGVLFGLAPAFQATRVDVAPALKDGTTTLNKAGHALRPGKVLVVVQIAACLLLLVGAGLFVRTLGKLENEDIGFNRRNLLLFTAQPGLNGYEGARLGAFYSELQRRIEAIPGVLSASLSQHSLIGAGMSSTSVSIPGYTEQGKQVNIHRNLIGPRFFETLGIPLVLGRYVGERDRDGSAKIVVINQQAAHNFFHGDNPIGKTMNFGDLKHPDPREIVGVVGDSRYGQLRKEAPPTAFVPFQQSLASAGFMSFEVRTAGDPQSMVAAVRREAQSVDKDLPLLNVKTQTEMIEESVFLERLFARLTTWFGLLGLALACVGLYGVMAYAVTRRTREIGIRLALGAQRLGILGMVLRETSLLLALGIAIGLAGAVAATRMLSSFLYGIQPNDPLTIVGATVVLSAAVGLAGYLPARWASRVDPMVALRYE